MVANVPGSFLGHFSDYPCVSKKKKKQKDGVNDGGDLHLSKRTSAFECLVLASARRRRMRCSSTCQRLDQVSNGSSSWCQLRQERAAKFAAARPELKALLPPVDATLQVCRPVVEHTRHAMSCLD